MVSCLKSNPGNCILDSCSSMQCQLESRFFNDASRHYAMHSDAQLIINYMLHHHLGTHSIRVSAFFQHHPKICHISMSE